MMYIHQKDIGNSDSIGKFAFKRSVRIYPMYWVLLSALIIAGLIAPGMGHSVPLSFTSITHNFSLIPMKSELMLEVAWTLQHEILFYTAFMSLLVSKRLGLCIMGIWFTLSAVSIFFPATHSPLGVLFSPYNLIFLGGMLSAILFKYLKGADSYVVITGGAFLFLFVVISELYGIFPLNDGWRTVGLGIGASMVIMGLVSAEGLNQIRSPNWLNKIGDSSYALYLIHLPVLTASVPIIKLLKLETFLPASIMLILLTIGCTIAGLITHYLIEKPLCKFCATRMKNIPKYFVMAS